MRRVGIFGTIALGLLGLVRLELLVVIGVNAVGIDKICIKQAASHVGFRHWQLVLLVQVLQHNHHTEIKAVTTTSGMGRSLILTNKDNSLVLHVCNLPF